MEAKTRSENVTDPPVHRVAIEVKGPWNQDDLTTQRDQLAIRYLPESDAGVGLYVVGWYQAGIPPIYGYGIGPTIDARELRCLRARHCWRSWPPKRTSSGRPRHSA